MYLHAGTCQIESPTVKCSNVDTSYSCQWTGELRNLEDHLKTCDYTPVPCPNQCDSNDPVLRKDIQIHLDTCLRRAYTCPDCGETGEYQERTTTHLEICQNVVVCCPNDECPVRLPRCELDTHRSACEMELVDCNYVDLGCKAKLYRKDLEEHEEESSHLRIALSTVHDMKRENASLSTKLSNVNIKLLQSTPKAVTFELTGFQKHKRDEDCFYSPSFYTSQNGYRICIAIHSNGQHAGRNTHVSVYAHLMKGEYDDSLVWPFTGFVNIGILNQLENENHRAFKIRFVKDNNSSQRVKDGERGLGYGFDLIPHTELGYDPGKNCQFLMDDRMVFIAAVEEDKSWLKCTLPAEIYFV